MLNPPRGNEALDFTPILSHYLFLGLTIVSVLSWVIAFLSQAIASAQRLEGAVNVLWFGIFLQLFLIAGIVYTLASDSIAMHRFQISVFGSIAIVFAVIGVNNGIFSGRPVLDAMSAGWLLLAMVDIIWVLYFTSEEDSLMLHIFNSMGTGGVTPPSRRRTRRTTPSVHMSANNGYATSYGGGGIGNDMTYGTKMGSGIGSGIGSGMGMGMGGGAPGSQRSFGQPADQRSLGGGSINNMGGSTVGAGGPGSISNVDTNGPNSPLMNSGSPGENAPAGENYSYKAKALYAYTASADDPNEISFQKGEILDILDKNGKWWQAKKADGSQGIAPSNYLQII